MFRHARTRGFTVAELLMVIGIVALLVGLTLPVLATVRTTAMESKGLSNLRQLGQAFGMYSTEYDAFPFAFSGFVRHPSWGEPASAVGFPIWHLRTQWVVVMHDILPWRESYTKFLSPGADESRFTKLWLGERPTVVANDAVSSYHYSNAFVVHPRVLSGQWAPSDTGGVQATRPGTVRHESAKVLLYDHEVAYVPRSSRGGRRPVLFCDGAGGIRRDGDAKDPVRNPLRDEEPTIYHDTEHGVQGVDF